MSDDVGEILRSVQAPARILHTSGSRFPDSVARHVAEVMPNGTYRELPKLQQGAAMGEAWEGFYAEIKELASGSGYGPEADRSLGTVLFTDIVRSSELLESIGDGRYRVVLAAHERQLRLAIDRSGGQLIKMMGDGSLSMFGNAASAVRCAMAITKAARELDIEVRAGAHTGEIERVGPDIAGLTVHVGARIGGAAQGDEVLVSRTVRDLVEGSGLSFTSRGKYELKGIAEPLELFLAAGDDGGGAELPIEPSMQTGVDRAVLAASRVAPRALRGAVKLRGRLQRRGSPRP